MPAELATATMFRFMEQTCVQGLWPFLNAGEHTVGTEVCISNCAATLPEKRVKAVIELKYIDQHSLHFSVACSTREA
jgi:fluoroacetyl-CoA thioesterase